MKCPTKLRRYHDKRLNDTNAKLIAALWRMAGNNPVHLNAVIWTKKAWAKEAGVNINTLVAKDGALFVFEEANAMFEQMRTAARQTLDSTDNPKMRQLQLENRALKQEIALLSREIAQLRAKCI